jgi:hypothetical protein
MGEAKNTNGSRRMDVMARNVIQFQKGHSEVVSERGGAADGPWRLALPCAGRMALLAPRALDAHLAFWRPSSGAKASHVPCGSRRLAMRPSPQTKNWAKVEVSNQRIPVLPSDVSVQAV